MILTEDEAKGKKCCQDTNQVCRASGCMGWRWAPPETAYAWRNTPSGYVEAFEANQKAGMPDPAVRQGYCGVAGP